MRRVPVGRTILVAGVCALIPLLGNVVASFVTDWTGERNWLVVPAVGVAVAMLTALVQAFGSAAGPPPAAERWPGDAAPYRPTPRYERGGTPLPVALLIVVVVLGVAGWGITQGVRYAVGYITGNESGTERLTRSASGTAGPLTITVESVEQTAHFTRVGLVARNASDESLTLNLFGNCVFVGGDGTTLEADTFKSRWSEELAPGSVQRGTVTFGGHVPDDVGVATFSCSRVFRFGPPLPPIKVAGLRLRPP